MGRYIYVQAMVNKSDDASCCGLISFRHAEVSANCEDTAYAAGHGWWKQNPVPSFVDSVANDYVIKVD